jgi:hypothetical protein
MGHPEDKVLRANMAEAIKGRASWCRTYWKVDDAIPPSIASRRRQRLEQQIEKLVDFLHQANDFERRRVEQAWPQERRGQPSLSTDKVRDVIRKLKLRGQQSLESGEKNLLKAATVALEQSLKHQRKSFREIVAMHEQFLAQLRQSRESAADLELRLPFPYREKLTPRYLLLEQCLLIVSKFCGPEASELKSGGPLQEFVEAVQQYSDACVLEETCRKRWESEPQTRSLFRNQYTAFEESQRRKRRRGQRVSGNDDGGPDFARTIHKMARVRRALDETRHQRL